MGSSPCAEEQQLQILLPLSFIYKEWCSLYRILKTRRSTQLRMEDCFNYRLQTFIRIAGRRFFNCKKEKEHSFGWKLRPLLSEISDLQDSSIFKMNCVFFSFTTMYFLMLGFNQVWRATLEWWRRKTALCGQVSHIIKITGIFLPLQFSRL